jgi:hypothetical protein
VEDVTIPDGTVVAPEAEVVKAWKVKNTGTTAWTEGCMMKMQTGRFGVAPFEGDVEQLNARVPPLAVGEEYVVEVKLQTPSESGRHVAYWRMCDPSGNGFGHRFWVDVVVEDDVVVDEKNVPLVSQSEETAAIGSVTAEADDGVLIDLTNSDTESEGSVVDLGVSEPSVVTTEVDKADIAADGFSAAVADVNTATDEEVEARVDDVVGELYEDALGMLEAMGFGNREQNRTTLAQWSGDLVEAVNSLLQDA